jgi:hypothetical protein
MTDPIHKYTQSAWQGDNYKSGMDIKDIAKALRKELKKKHPDHKFSVRIERYSGGQSMNIELMSAPYKPIIESISEEWQDGERVRVHKPVKEQVAQLNHHCLDDYKSDDDSPYVRNNGYVIDDRAIEVMKTAVGFAQGYNYDDSDSMIDYFNTNFYLHIGIGRWDKECENTEVAEKLIEHLEKSITKTEDLIKKFEDIEDTHDGHQESERHEIDVDVLCEKMKEENNILWLYKDENDVSAEDYTI